MKIKLISFATKNYSAGADRLLKSISKYGIEAVLFTGDDFSKTSFFKTHHSITRQTRGYGYWLWKPYYIVRELERLEENDVLIYCDAGIEFISDPAPLVQKTQLRPVVLFENYQGYHFIHKTDLSFSEYNYYTEINKIRYWCKSDAWSLMGLSEEKYLNCQSVDASMVIIKKNNESIAFCSEWLKYCTDERILTDIGNRLNIPNSNNFIEHRHDQSVLSLMAARYQLELFRTPSQFGNHYKGPQYRVEKEEKILPYSEAPKNNSDYPTITNHHRDRLELFPKRLKSFMEREWYYFQKKTGLK